MIIAPVAQTGRGREHTARASGDGYNRLPEPHTHLCSQQAALSKRGALQGKGLCLLLIWPLQYSLFFGGVFPPLYPALVSLWHSQRGKHDSSSSARHTAVRLGFFFFTLSSIATARLTENMYKFCSILGRCNYKVSFLVTNSVCHLIVKCFKTKTGRPGQKPKGSSPLS